MNIFILFNSPEQSAKILCDVHVVKMLLESVQLLCMAWHSSKSVHTWPLPLYKVTHFKHVCARWVCSDIQHYEWLLNHAIELSKEYTTRYKKDHKSNKILQMLQTQGIPTLQPTQTNLNMKKTQFAFEDIPDNVKSIPIAIPDQYFKQCAKYDDRQKLLGIATMRNYYCLKSNIMKRKMKWNQKLLPPPQYIKWMENFTCQIEFDNNVV